MNHRLASSVAAAYLLIPLAFGQGILIDNFNAGNFSVSGNAGDTYSAVQTGSTDDLIGGSRGVTIEPAGSYNALGANGYLSVEVDNPGLDLELVWGKSAPLGLNLAAITDGGFLVSVYQGFTAYADVRFTAITASGQASISPFVSVTHDGDYFIPFSQFVAASGGNAADFSQINQIVFSAQLSPVGAGAYLSIDSIVASSVPEPEEWATLAGVVLVGFGIWRRRASFSTHR